MECWKAMGREEDARAALGLERSAPRSAGSCAHAHSSSQVAWRVAVNYAAQQLGAARVMKQCVARIGNALLGESLWRFVRWSVGKKNLPHMRVSVHGNVRDRWITAFLSERTSASSTLTQAMENVWASCRVSVLSTVAVAVGLPKVTSQE